MASVSGSGGDSISRLKEQFQLRERESDDKHRDEVNQLRRGHHAEIEKLTTENTKRVSDVREESAVKLNQKDIQFQKEVDAIRSMYGRRLAEAKQDVES